MGLKFYAYLAAGLALAYSYFWMYSHGKTVCRAEMTVQVLAAKKSENEAIKQTQAKAKELKALYAARERLIKESTDACMATRLPAPVLDQLRHDLPPE